MKGIEFTDMDIEKLIVIQSVIDGKKTGKQASLAGNKPRVNLTQIPLRSADNRPSERSIKKKRRFSVK